MLNYKQFSAKNRKNNIGLPFEKIRRLKTIRSERNIKYLIFSFSPILAVLTNIAKFENIINNYDTKQHFSQKLFLQNYKHFSQQKNRQNKTCRFFKRTHLSINNLSNFGNIVFLEIYFF